MKSIFATLIICSFSCACIAQGIVFADYNCNALYDDLDHPLSHATIVNQLGEPVAITNLSGEYMVHLLPNTSSTLSVATAPGMISEYVTISSGAEDLYYSAGNIPVCINNVSPDLSVSISEVTPAVPGQSFSYDICVRYTGSEAAEVNLQFDTGFPGGVILTDTDGAAEINGEWWWIISGMQPFTDTCFQVSASIFGSLPAGTPLHPSADVSFVNPGIVDANPSDNAFEFPHKVQAFLENNQKWVNKELVNYLDIIIEETTTLDYTIRFANTGNDTIHQVRITDIVESLLQSESFFMVESDEDYLFSRTDSLLYWEINTDLPPCSADPLGCRGYMHFQLTSIENPLSTDSINNYASIQFDMLVPTLTDTVLTTFSQCADFLDIIGPDSACVGSTLNYTTSVGGFPSYLWVLDGVLVSNTQNYTLVNAAEGLHTLGLVATDGFCTLSQTLELEVDEPAFISITEAHDSICNTEPLHAYHNGVITWYYNGEAISGSDTLHIFENGLYTASVLNACSAISFEEYASIDPGPESITIEQNGYQLTASEDAMFYQWYIDNTELTDSFAQSIVASETGNYWVQAFISSGCVVTSEWIFLETDLQEVYPDIIHVYPIPADNFIVLQTRQSAGMEFYELFDLTGRKITSGSFTQTKIIPVNEISEGQYILRVTSGPIQEERHISIHHH